jgi:hypothetical protein
MVWVMMIKKRKTMIYLKQLVSFVVLAIIVAVLNYSTPTLAQDGAPPPSPQPGLVPDLTGLNAPQAAALLNRNSLILGAVFTVSWQPTSSTPPNLIGLGGQSIAPGQIIPLGTAVDIAISRAPNTVLLYDDNDITLINYAGVPLDIGNVTFSSLDGATPTSFAAGRWGPTLREGRCMQLWSVGRNGPKAVEGCEVVQGWLTTTNMAEHFWTGSNGAVQFQVIQNGASVGVCVISAQKCDFYLEAAGGASDEVSYIYLAYTTDRLIIMNNSSNQWMPLAGTIILNNVVAQPGIPLAIGDPVVFGNPVVYGQIDRLAPNQCLYLTNGAPFDPSTPQPCDVLVRLDLAPHTIFWTAPFEIDAVTRDKNGTCPAATPGRLTICAMPR